jgi:hypothetical protein
MDETTAALITDLKAAIAELEAGTEEAADRVADLAGRIERRLDAEAELHDDDDTLGEEIREGAVRFEADHPKLADALRRIVDAIGGIGI